MKFIYIYLFFKNDSQRNLKPTKRGGLDEEMDWDEILYHLIYKHNLFNNGL